MWLLLSHIACSKFSFKILTNLKPWWQKLCEGTKGVRQKVWPRTKILNPNIRYIVAILWFVAIYALFGRIFTYIYYIENISYYTELNLQFAITRKNDSFVAIIANTRLRKLLWPFLPSQEGCQPLPPCLKPKSLTKRQPQSLDQTSALKTWQEFSLKRLIYKLTSWRTFELASSKARLTSVKSTKQQSVS